MAPLAFWVGAVALTLAPHHAYAQYWSQYERCPQSCAVLGEDPAKWTHYHDTDVLATCDETLLFDVGLNVALQDNFFIRACSTTGKGARVKVRSVRSVTRQEVTAPHLANSTGPLTCGSLATKAKADLAAGWTGSADGKRARLTNGAHELSRYLKDAADCGTISLLAYAEGAVVGVYVGGDFQRTSAASLVGKFLNRVPTGSAQSFLQACNPHDFTSQNFGVFADARGNISAVQSALRTWSESKCLDVTEFDSTKTLAGEEVGVFASTVHKSFAGSANSTNGTFTLERRADCRAVEVVSGDSCAALATRCGISGDDFMKFNTKKDLCSSLMPKQFVCCNKGDTPDPKPKKQGDGSCFPHEVGKGESCWSIAEQFYLKSDDIEKLNKKTWGWSGCSALLPQQMICLSEGTPPMPLPISNAVCGPQKPCTKEPCPTKPPSDKSLADMNPCPLKACCNIWGQCGTTDDFCTVSPSDTGAPGSTKNGTWSCVSNCGTKIVNNAKGPDKYFRIGYFEAWNFKRDCLNMHVTQTPSGFTHIHFAFATITPDFKVSIKGIEDQFDKLKGMKDVKKILSFGGWSFSTDQDTFPIFRDAVTDANRLAFANNAVEFLKTHNLDGLDFDWEYPGAPDIPGVPAGSDSEAPNYLKFLQMVRSRLPSGKSLSIALPASFWYLKAFPIEDMNKVVDYFIYMTYDLHGQWDYNNSWASPGCKSGNCLRSHINMTETMNALSMVTKAGAETRKLIVGVTSYGRSFRMAKADCDGPNCFFTGSANVSEAEPGECTGTSGYIADAEIRRINNFYAGDSRDGFKSWYDKGSESDIMVWPSSKGNNWVSYMGPDEKKKRIDKYKGLNMGGTTDWAIDLGAFYEAEKGGAHDNDDGDVGAFSAVCDKDYKDLDSIERDAETIPVNCRSLYTIEVLSLMLDQLVDKYHEVIKNYDGKFGYYADWVREMIDPALQDFMSWPKDGPGNKYFSCVFKDDTNTEKYRGKCPPPKDLRPQFRDEGYHLDYHLDDEKGFYDQLEKDKGIPKDWVKFGDYDTGMKCTGPKGPPGKTDPCIPARQMHKNYPLKADKVEVVDPKKIFDEALPNLDTLKDNIAMAYLGVGIGNWEVDGDGVAGAITLPVFMMEQAISTMEQVKEIGGKMEEKEKRDRIMLIISIIFMVIPFVGEIGFALAGATAAARIAFMIGEAANAAMTIADIVEDPESAPFAIMGMLLGIGTPKGLKGSKAFNDASLARKVMDESGDMAKMGDIIKNGNGKVQGILKACFR
ncbi:hypothetical protein B0H67DRAFT_498289 [Lasiosphaeris hirsuta]|uniref:chitinase n=1 Tax=Lasiosphaeris hirsuta TaxID=260670 RepID=A0AA40DKX2_9PEZI|nr:hypothetical protein B0H67DRAFT_498289 [Lasiosphaeris hirsuta]